MRTLVLGKSTVSQLVCSEKWRRRNHLTSSSAANNESSAGGVENHSHNRFWVLNTRDINAFIAAQLNRWLLCLEVLIGRVKAGEDGRPAASQEEQLINGVMVSAVVRMLRMCFSTNLSLHPSM